MIKDALDGLSSQGVFEEESIYALCETCPEGSDIATYISPR